MRVNFDYGKWMCGEKIDFSYTSLISAGIEAALDELRRQNVSNSLWESGILSLIEEIRVSPGGGKVGGIEDGQYCVAFEVILVDETTSDPEDRSSKKTLTLSAAFAKQSTQVDERDKKEIKKTVLEAIEKILLKKERRIGDISNQTKVQLAPLTKYLAGGDTEKGLLSIV